MNDEKPDSLEEAQEKYLAHYFERNVTDNR